MSAIVEFEHVSFRYAGSDRKVMENISLSVQPSEFVVICGQSGCGKTTLLRHMKKNFMPYGDLEGNVFYRGTNIQKLDDRISAAGIGFVQQSPESQIVTDKVWHELAFGLESLGMRQETIQRRVAEMASYFGIQNWFRKNTAELSGGQKQLLNLASIMVMQPQLLLLDEPTSQLDPIAASEFIQTLSRIHREIGTTIIISEHRLEELFPAADRVIVMEQGRIEADGTPEQIGRFFSEREDQPMFYGMPAVMKIAAKVCKISGKEEAQMPITVSQGRLWLEQKLGQPRQLPDRRQDSTDQKTAGRRQNPADQKITARKRKRRDGEEMAAVLKDVWFRYEKGMPDVLRGLDLSVKKGEWFAVLGGNGAGKSTMLSILCGMIKPYRGKVSLDGKTAVLPQNPQALFTEITVREELTEAFCYTKKTEKEKMALADAMLEQMDLRGLEDMHPYDLSGGEQQRLALGKILLLQPSILLLDEPTKGLDPFFKRKLAEILTGLKQKGITILMVSHDMEFCAGYADRCTLFFDGKSIPAQSPQEFFAGNYFYTTSANRVAGAWFQEAVTWEEAAEKCQEAIRKNK